MPKMEIFFFKPNKPTSCTQPCVHYTCRFELHNIFVLHQKELNFMLKFYHILTLCTAEVVLFISRNSGSVSVINPVLQMRKLGLEISTLPKLT
jgi:hypothetical protein